MKFFGAVLGVILFLTGCATPSTVVSRKQERYAAYQAMPPEIQAAIDQGQLKAGMNMDAVYIVWGHPSQVVSGGNAGGETTTWLYEGGYVQETRFWGGYRMHYGYTPMTYVRAQVVFSGGVVREWQTFPVPTY